MENSHSLFVGETVVAVLDNVRGKVTDINPFAETFMVKWLDGDGGLSLTYPIGTERVRKLLPWETTAPATD
jgi:hypothetical protein